MKCPSCNAETKDAKYCEYCGSELPKENQNINVTNNYYGTVNNNENGDAGKCPRCHSNSVKYQREKVGEIGSSTSKKVGLADKRKGNSVQHSEYRTVGICQKCGFTWNPNLDVNDTVEKKKSKGCLWWFLLLCIWPIALSVWFYKTDKVKLDKKIKLGIIAVFWVFVLVFGSSSEDSNVSNTETSIELEVQDKNIDNIANETEGDSQTSTTEITEVEETVVVEEPAEIEESVEKQEAVEEEPTTEETTKADDNVSAEFRNALKKAEQYSSMMHMSQKGIYDQLTSEYGEKFPADAAQYAIDHVEADWNANALAKAKTYSDTMYMSKKGVYDQLTSEYGEKFSAEEAQYAIDHVEADWNANALAKAKNYSDTMYMSKKGIYDQLTSEYGEKFSAEEAQYAIDHVEVDWNANALEKAKSYQESMNMSSSAIYDQLISEYGEKFTKEEAQYAVDNLK